MKYVIACLAFALAAPAFADSGTQGPALSGVSPQAASAAAKTTADRRAVRVAKRKAKSAAKASSVAAAASK